MGINIVVVACGRRPSYSATRLAMIKGRSTSPVHAVPNYNGIISIFGNKDNIGLQYVARKYRRG